MNQPYPQQQFGAPVQNFQQAPQQFQQPMPVQPGYPQQQFGQVPMQQYAPQPAAAPLAQGSLDDFFDQPTVGGGQALKFDVLGRTFDVEVSRPITKADIQQQTDTRGIPQFFRDGRPKFQMIVPCTVLADGSAATWYVKGATREKLAAAMAAAGAPAGPPEAGARMRLTYVADVPTGAGFNPRKEIDVQYARPSGALLVDSPQAAATVVAEQVRSQTVQQAAAAPMTDAQAEQRFVQQFQAPPVNQAVGAPPWQQQQQIPAGVGPQPMPVAPAPQQFQAQPVQQGPAGLPAAPAGLTPEQQAAYDQMIAQIGGQAPTA